MPIVIKKLNMENEVCRLCLADSITYDEDNSNDGKIHILMPEIDLNITPNFTLCEDCCNNLTSAYTFKQKCLKNEERIKNYISKTRTTLINLRCIRDQMYSDRNESLEVVTVKEHYDYLKNASITDSINIEDYENVDSVNEKHHLTFPKIEIFEQSENECTSKDCKEEIEDEVESDSFKVFVCEICMDSFKEPIELDRHRIIHSNSNTSQLNDNYSEKDPLTFPNQEIFKCHIAEYATNHCIKQESKSSEIFVCEVCKESFKEYTELDQHRMVHFKKDMFPCDLCDKKFSQQLYLTRHKMIHSKETIRYFCDVCNKGFRWKQSLDTHKGTHNNKIHTCPICSKSCRNLKDHMRSTHMKKHTCNICGMKFGSKSRLLRHTGIHTGDASYKCEVCGKCFGQKSNLGTHMQSHQKEKPFICNTCQKGYMSKASLDAHIIVHMPNLEKPFVCEILTCSKRFKTSNSLWKHMCRHRVQKTHMCNVCHKGFAAPSHLKTHMRSHTGERPYECDICHKRFTEKTALGRHSKIHKQKEI